MDEIALNDSADDASSNPVPLAEISVSATPSVGEEEEEEESAATHVVNADRMSLTEEVASGESEDPKPSLETTDASAGAGVPLEMPQEEVPALLPGLPATEVVALSSPEHVEDPMRTTNSPIPTDTAEETNGSTPGPATFPRPASPPPPVFTPTSNTIFLHTALTKIAKGTHKKHTALHNSLKKALEKLEVGQIPTAVGMFEPLRLTLKIGNVDTKIIALDCFTKLFSFSLFDDCTEVPPAGALTLADPEDPSSIVTPPPRVPLVDAAITAITESFQVETFDAKMELQVIRALMSAVLGEKMPAHGSSLLTAVRQLYNIFLLSLSTANQGIAQASLTQIIASVYGRVSDLVAKGVQGSSDQGSGRMSPAGPAGAVTPEVADGVIGEASETKGLTLETDAVKGDLSGDMGEGPEGNHLTLSNLTTLPPDVHIVAGTDHELYVKDAFLLFRTLCKLSVKDIVDGEDMRSQAVRSKLLSLHIVHSILKEYIDIFLSDLQLGPNRFIDAIKQYLCLALSKNAALAVSPVYELCLEIFWLLVSNLRSEFKRAIPVFLDEIYFPVAETKTSSPHQKRYFVSIVERVCYDPRVVIEFYLNYDCDSTMPNICEHLIDYLTRLCLTRVDVTPVQREAYAASDKAIAFYNLSMVPSQAISSVGSKHAHIDSPLPFPVEFSLQMVSIKCIVGVLQSLHSWAQKGITVDRRRANTVGSITPSILASPSEDPLATTEKDDPAQFASLKQRKTMLQEGIKLFNFSPKRGLVKLIRDGFTTAAPEDVARFCFTEGLDKAQLGEFLGEGDETHIAIMHSFVNQMDFINLGFVDAMRIFLQSFRLPGESQKIDRFMLKFAERYVLGNPGVFANADTAYILAYSVVMLNTDQHSAQVKNRMTLEDFLKNNRGIDDGADLPREFLARVFTEIQGNEIKLHSEQHAAMLAGGTGARAVATGAVGSGASGFFTRDTSRDAYNQISRELSSKTIEALRTLRVSSTSPAVFFAASHVSHVKSIFDTLWMSLLAGLTLPFKEYDDEDTTQRCLEGIRLAIKIAGMFELEYALTSFIGALVQFANLNNIEEMRSKNVEAVHVLLDVAADGDQRTLSWELVLRSISQIERLQLIARGVDSDSIPDVSLAKMANRESIDSTRTTPSYFGYFGSSTPSQQASLKHFNQNMSVEVLRLLSSAELSASMDRIFEQSANLSGAGIVAFVKALTVVSSEEVESSGKSSHPRMFSLQKMVDVCYYNMDRIRLEWANLWAIMGDKFNTFGCDANLVIVFFALDSLRQLSMRFLEIEELAQFKFQKEFLKPFEHVMIHNPSEEVQEMVLECLGNMLLAKADKVRSGWTVIFKVLEIGAGSPYLRVVTKTDSIMKDVHRQSVHRVCEQGAFGEMVLVYVALAMNTGFQKVGLHSLTVLKRFMNEESDRLEGVQAGRGGCDPKIEEVTSLSVEGLTVPPAALWYLLSGLQSVVMKGEDLEIRSRALNYMFDALIDHGQYFEPQFWDSVCAKLLFPVFGGLTTHWEVNQVGTDDALSVWLSTTMIQALRNMVALFTHYFEALSRLTPGFLDLLVSCVCQENDTIARIGRSCLQLMVVENVDKFGPAHWEQVTAAYVRLFDLTTAKELFKADPLNSTYAVIKDGQEVVHNLNTATVEEIAELEQQKAKDRSAIVVKCVLQLLMIESVSELLLTDAFYNAIPMSCMTRFTALLDVSFRFARDFNEDYNLRVRLYNSGVIDRLPNLLKQESSAAAVLIGVQFKLYCDPTKVDPASKKAIVEVLIPLCNGLIDRYVSFDEPAQLKNVLTWRPVVVEILHGYYELEESDFVEHCPVIHDLVLRLLDRDIQEEVRLAVKGFLARVGDLFFDRL